MFLLHKQSRGARLYQKKILKKVQFVSYVSLFQAAFETWYWDDWDAWDSWIDDGNWFIEWLDNQWQWSDASTWRCLGSASLHSRRRSCSLAASCSLWVPPWQKQLEYSEASLATSAAVPRRTLDLWISQAVRCVGIEMDLVLCVQYYSYNIRLVCSKHKTLVLQFAISGFGMFWSWFLRNLQEILRAKQ